jgi:hypothetical protein
MLSSGVSHLFGCSRRKVGVTELPNVVVSYYCTVVNGQKGCCKNGKICTSGGGGGGGCVNSGYVPCAGDSFCCRTYPIPTCLLCHLLTTTGFPLVLLAAGYTCYRDSANSPKCSLSSPYTITSTSTIRKPSSTSTSPLPTKTPDGDDGDSNDDSSDDSLPDGDSSSDSDSSDSDESNTNGSNGSNSTSSSSSSSSSSSPRPSPSGVTSSTLNGATGSKGSSGLVGLAPFLVFIGMCL